MSKRPKSIDVRTFGCRLNAFESEVVRAHGVDANLDNTIVFNTCAVTTEAERQARQAIRRARRENPDAEIVVTGCAAQIDPARFQAMPEVDRVVGNEEKMRRETWLPENAHEPLAVADIMTVRETAPHLIEGFDGRSRAFVQVQQGCDHRCTFCIIPYGRGNNRSLPLGAIVDQVRQLVAGGLQEVVLTGVDITSYGDDLPGRPRLGNLARRLLHLVPELQRLRFSSLDPVGIDDTLLTLIAHEPRVMPHIHLSLQAGQDMVLKRMKRRHLTADVDRLIDRLRQSRPDLALGADIIAGFPTESDAMHATTLANIAAWEIPFLHIFPYSPRPGTPAARMPQVAGETRRQRAADLRAVGDRIRERFFSNQIGHVVSVLVERPGFGHADNYAPVNLQALVRQGDDLAREAAPGSIVTARVIGLEGRHLQAEIVPGRVAA